MSEMDFPEQASELAELVKRSGLTADEVAVRSILKPDTFRKYLGGYQRAGKRTMEAIRGVVKLEEARMNKAAGDSDLPRELHDEAFEWAGKLLKLSPGKQDLAKKLVNELHGTKAATVSYKTSKKKRKSNSGAGRASGLLKAGVQKVTDHAKDHK